VSFNALNEFRVSYFGFGPTEGRIGFMVANGLLIIFGSIPLSNYLPYLLGFTSLALIFTVWKTQKIIWAIDMNDKNVKKSK